MRISDWSSDVISSDLNGKQALEVLAAHLVQLVVSDVMMPEMDGYELCQRIKSNIAYSHIPIILLTAKNTLKSKLEGLAHGADAYIRSEERRVGKEGVSTCRSR